MIDVTERAAARLVGWSGDAGWFVRGMRASNLRWICGLDVNRRPVSLMALKIWATAATLHDPAAWGVAVVGEVGRASVESIAAFSDFAAVAAGGRFAGTLVYADPQHCHREKDLRHAATPATGNESAVELARGFDCRPAATRLASGAPIPGQLQAQRHVPASPSRGDSHELLQRLMYERRFYVSPQCPRLRGPGQTAAAAWVQRADQGGQRRQRPPVKRAGRGPLCRVAPVRRARRPVPSPLKCSSPQMNLTRGRPSGSVTSDVRVTTPEGYTLDLVSATDDARQVLVAERRTKASPKRRRPRRRGQITAPQQGGQALEAPATR